MYNNLECTVRVLQHKHSLLIFSLAPHYPLFCMFLPRSLRLRGTLTFNSIHFYCTLQHSQLSAETKALPNTDELDVCCPPLGRLHPSQPRYSCTHLFTDMLLTIIPHSRRQTIKQGACCCVPSSVGGMGMREGDECSQGKDFKHQAGPKTI